MLLFVFPGYVQKLNASPLAFEELVKTGTKTGTVAYDQIMMPAFFGSGGGLNPQSPLGRDGQRIHDGRPYSRQAERGLRRGCEQVTAAISDKAADTTPEINVVLVADIDPLYRDFFELRAQGTDPDREFNLNADNVTFVLNTLDELAGDDRFIDIRKRRPQHRVLTQDRRPDGFGPRCQHQKRKKFNEEFDQAIAKEQQKLNDKVDELKKAGGDTKSMLQQIAMAQAAGQAELESKTNDMRKTRDKEIKKIDTRPGHAGAARCRISTSCGL